MIRTLVTTVAALCLCVAITGCGDDDADNGNGDATGDNGEKTAKRPAAGSTVKPAQDADGG